MIGRSRSWPRITIALASLVAGLWSCGGDSRPRASAPPAPAATAPERLVQDIDYLASELPRLHPNLFFRISRGEFDAVVAGVRARAPSAREHEGIAGLMRIAAAPGDAHTTAYRWRGFRHLPLALSRLEGGLYVTAAAASHAAALGLRVVAVGEVDVAELESRVRAFVSHENEAWFRVQAASLLAIPEMLHVLGATGDPSGVTFWLEASDGARVRMDADALGAPPTLVGVRAASGAAPPLHEQRRSENYWVTLEPESRTAYLQYNRCQEGPESMATVAGAAFRLVEQGSADRLVVDIRHNGGGNSEVDNPLIDGLRSRPALRQRGRLYGLISGETFSSGMWTADDLRNLGAILVGGPTGGKPNSYGNTALLQIPNSLLQVSYSTRHYELVSGSDPPWIAPHLAVEPTIADLRAGRDPLLEAALADGR